MSAGDWFARSKREAAAMLAEAHVMTTAENYDALVRIIAGAYRKGAEDGMKRAIEIFREESVGEGVLVKRRVWLTYVVTVPDADTDRDAETIAIEQVGIGYASPDSVEIERVNESASRKAWTL